MSDDGMIRIRIGASTDRSVDTVFGTIEKRAQRARDNIAKALGGAGGSAGMRALGASVEKSMGQAERASTRTAKATAREHDRAAREVEKSWDRQARAAERAMQAEHRAVERGLRAQMRERENALRTTERQTRAADREQRKFGYRTAYHSVIRYAPGAAGFGRRIGSDILRGAGVDMSPSGSVSRAVGLEREATALSNSSFMGGQQGPAGTRVNPQELISFAQKAADAAGVSPEEVMTGLREYVGRTGDLATAKQSLPGLLKLSKATGANPADVLSFAGTTAATVYTDLAGSLDEAAERAKFLFDVMNVGAGGGKLGTVEFDNLASQGPKLAAAANAFEGDKSKNLSEMMALAQMGLAGGAASPTQAATSVAAMTNTLRTPARRRHFEDAGVNLDGGNGKLRSAQDVIIESIHAAGTDTAKFKSMWANVQGGRSVEGLRQRYLEAGGGASGIKALRAEFSKFGSGAALSEQEINTSFAASMNTAATKAQLFQNNLDKIVQVAAQDLIPAMQKLGPTVLKGVDAFSKVASWASQNQGKAVALAIGASIARAGIESVLRAGIERWFAGELKLPGGMKVAGSVMIAAAAVTIAAEQASELKKEIGSDSWLGMLPGFSGEGDFSLGRFGKDMTTGVGDIYANKANENLNKKAREEAIAKRKSEDAANGIVRHPLSQAWEERSIASVVGKPPPNWVDRQQPVDAQPGMSAADVERAMRAALQGGVRITNAADFRPEAPGPRVDGNGRSPR